MARRRSCGCESGLLDRDRPARVGDPIEVGDRVAVLSRPLRDRLGGLSAVEVDDEFITVGQAGHGLLGFDEGEGADLAVGFEYLLHTVPLSAAGTAVRDVVGLMVAIAAIPTTAIIKTIETQPWYSNGAVETMALLTVQPRAMAAPTPMPIPPKIDLMIVS